MRKLWLENENGVKYSFENPNKCLSSTLSNFGIELNNTYYEYSNSFQTSVTKMTMMKPTMNLYFIEGYTGYSEFINYAYRAKELKLYYESNDIKYCYVDIEKLSKGELSGNYLTSQIVFNRKSMWMKEYSVIIEASASAVGKAYNYVYDYRYIEIDNNEILITNNGSVPAPINFKIKGAMSNPRVDILVNDEIISTCILNIVSENGELEVISEEGKESMQLLENDKKINVYQEQDFTTDGFLFAPLGNSRIRISSGTLTANRSYELTFHELYRGN